MNGMAVARLLRSAREKEQLAQIWVAKQLKVTRQYYGEVERGHIPISLKRIPQLVKLLKISPYEMGVALRQDFEDKLKEYLSGA